MKNKLSQSERLSDALGNIDDSLLLEAYDIDSADKLKRESRKALCSRERIRKLASLAACIILLVGAASVIPYLRHINDKRLPANTDGSAISSPASPLISSTPEVSPLGTPPLTPTETPVSTPPRMDETYAETPAGTPPLMDETHAETPAATPGEMPVGTPEASYEESPAETPYVSSAGSAACTTPATPSAGEEPDVPLSPAFTSRDQLVGFIKAASLSPEAYAEYLEGCDLSPQPTYDVATAIAQKLSGAELLISLKDSPDGVTESRYFYDVAADTLIFTVTAGGVRIEFIHSFASTDVSAPSGELAMGGVPIGDRFIDLYRRDGDLIGTLTVGGETVTVHICAENAEADILSPFDTLSGRLFIGESDN